ncbi:MAG: hypothetical protein AB1349_12730 [Elusimicrobiota bacterium]
MSIQSLVSFIFGCLLMVSNLVAQSTENSLKKEWENIQKNSSQTLNFEKIEEDRYKFKTKMFPFEGELKVLNVVIEETEIGFPEDGYITGTVETELVGWTPEQIQKYSASYYRWQRNNTLYYDKKEMKWISPKEFQERMMKKSKSMLKSPLFFLSNYSYLIFFLILIALVIVIAQKSSKRMKIALKQQDEALKKQEKFQADYDRSLQLGERNVQLTEENNKILKEILEVLKNKPQN